jgi:type IV secretion system protein TrbL
VRAGSSLAAGASTAYGLGQAASGETGAVGVAGGVAGVATAGAGAVMGAARSVGERLSSNISESARDGRRAAWRATGGRGLAAETGPVAQQTHEGSAPDWARRLRGEQRMRARVHAAEQAIKEGDKPGAAANPDLDDRE